MKKPRDYKARFWSRVKKTDSCWLWQGTINGSGYGVMRVDCIGGSKGRLIFAHRYSFEQHKGQIPEGLHLDHLCRVRNCCNPDHLEAVTNRENWARGFAPSALQARQTHCMRGHELSGANLYLRPDTGTRQCLTCKHEYFGRWYEKKKKEITNTALVES